MLAATTTGLSCSRSPDASRPGNSVELPPDDVEVLDRIAAGGRRDVDEVHQHLRPLEMAQEPMPQPMPLVRAFNQAGHVGDDERALARQTHDAEIGHERRERVVGDLRACAAEMREISVDLPAFGNPTSPTSASSFRCSRRSFSSPGSPGCASAARDWSTWRTTRCRARRDRLGDQDALSVFRQIGDLSTNPSSCFARRPTVPIGTCELDVVAVLAGPVRAFAVAAATGLEELLEAEIEKRVEVGVGDEVDVAAGAAVAAVRAAARDELLAAEAHGATAAVAGGDVDVDFVYEHRQGEVWTARWSGRSDAKHRLVDYGSVRLGHGLQRQYADHAAARAVILELDRPVDLREERVVLAEPDVQPGRNRRPR